MKKLWAAGLCLASAVVAVLLFADSPTERVYNLDLTNPEIGDTYLILHRREPERCFVVDRRDATIRRSDDNQPGRKWRCHQIASPEGGEMTWLVQSKRKGKGTVFLVPVSEVSDWGYPFLYGFVREHRPELELPKVEWTQLFVSRIYQGLYLRVELPFDRRKKDGGSGVLREILSVEGGRSSVVNTRFEEVRGLFNDSVALAKPPTLGPQPDALVWLALRNSTREQSFLMSASEPYELQLLPLPISLPTIYERRNGRRPISFEDRRFAGWLASWRPEGDAMAPPFEASELASLQPAFETYSTGLRRALSVDAQRKGLGDVPLAGVSERLTAIAGLGLHPVGPPPAEAL